MKLTNLGTIADQIHDLCGMNDFIRNRTRDHIQRTLANWEVCSTEDEGVIGCCEMIPCDEQYTELGALMVHPDFVQNGIGERLWTGFNHRVTTPLAFSIVSKHNEIAQRFFGKRPVEQVPEFPSAIDLTTRNIQDRVCFVWQPKP